jgi:toxoflavin biosynthesis protein ToxD
MISLMAHEFGVGPVLAIPACRFEMGSSLAEIELTHLEWRARLVLPEYGPRFREWLMKEYPAHPVVVAAFSITRYPVTNGAYRVFLHTRLEIAPPESIAAGLPDDHPVWGVSLARVEAFIRWQRQRDGRPWRLPTEAEWEWAARGPEGLRYPYGNSFRPNLCNTIDSGCGVTTPVDAFPGGASPWGICDMAGNVEEWTASHYAPYPGGRVIEDDLWRMLGPDYPILRGGSFELGGDLTRTRRRHGPHPGRPFRVTGFRLALDGGQ